MKKIMTHLWFNTEAKEAAAFYTSLFDDAKIISTRAIHGTPSGDVDIVTIDLPGQTFTLISAGPLFTFNPSISFLIACGSKEEVTALWEKLSPGGKALKKEIE